MMPILKRMLESLPQSAAFFDQQHRCVFANQAWQDRLGDFSLSVYSILDDEKALQLDPAHSEKLLKSEQDDRIFSQMPFDIVGAGKPRQFLIAGQQYEGHIIFLMSPDRKRAIDQQSPTEADFTKTNFAETANIRDAQGALIILAEPKTDDQTTATRSPDGAQASIQNDIFSLDLYKKIQKLTKQTLWALNIATGKVQWSPEWLAVFGYKQNEIEADLRSFKHLCHPDDQTVFFKNLQRAINDHEFPFYVECRLRGADGAYVWTSCEAFWVKADDGFAYLIGVQHIIARQKEKEQALIEAREKADENTRAKTAFLATMSHEIRTPLNGMMGMLEMLSFQEMSEEGQEWVKIAKQSSDALLAIVNGILDISKLENGSLMLESRVYDSETLFSQAVNLIRPRIEQKGLAFEWDIKDMPHKSLRGDPVRINQIIYNLLNNALKFTEKGFIRFSVDGQLLEDEPLVAIKITVEDSGIGISDTDMARIFKSFEQGDMGDQRCYEGLGLGLSLTQKLLDLMEGTLTVTSRLGKGTCFTVTIAQHIARDEGHAFEDQPALPAILQSCVILVAEDNIINQKLIASFLKRLGLGADFVKDGAEAIEAVRAKAYDLILMDVQMPNVSGLDATKMIRQEGFTQIPIVAITANAFDSDRARCLKAGMSDFLAKPFGAKHLAQVIERQLGQTILGARSL